MKLQPILILFCVFTLLLSSCTKQLITPQELEKLKADKTGAETKNLDLQKQVDDLKMQVDQTKMKAQLTDALLAGYNAQPYDPALPDHKWAAMGDGSYLFLHFNKDVNKADDLLYYGLALPGKFCKEDQDQLPPGFVHFHQAKCAEKDEEKCHGGKGGEDGFWLMHVAAKEMDMPWGHVKPGVDLKFMPTPAPSCAPAEDTGDATP